VWLKKFSAWFGWEGVVGRLPRLIKWTVLLAVLFFIFVALNRANAWIVQPLSYHTLDMLASRLAWPATVALIAYLFRRPLTTLIDSIEYMKLREWEGRFSNRMGPPVRITNVEDQGNEGGND
jgi:hypothetical protein